MASEQEDNHLWKTQKIFRLLESDYDYLHGDDTNYSNSDMEDRVLEKVDLIPKRIESLRYDVSWLNDEGYFEGERWHSRVGGLFQQSEDLTGKSVLATNEQARTLGHDLGIIANYLIAGVDELDDPQIRQQIVWGFIERFYPISSSWSDDEEVEMEELTDFIEQAHQKRQDRLWEDIKEFEERQDIAREMQLHILRSFEDERIALPEVTSIPDYERNRFAAVLVLCGYLDSEVASHESPSEQWDQFIDQIDPPTFDISSELSPDKIRSHLDDGVIEILEEIDPVNRDTRRVLETSWRGVEMAAVLRTVADNPGISSKDIENSLENSNQSAITRLAKDMAGMQREHGEVFERPLVDGDKDGWTLTEYGELVYASIAEPSGPIPGFMRVSPHERRGG